MGDYPDWTGLEHIVGTNIMLAVDVQGGYIMLPVDWQSQFAGVFLQPDWTALQGTDKNFHCGDTGQGYDGAQYAEYDVPAGKTLYICGASFSSMSERDRDSTVAVYFKGYLFDFTAGIVLAPVGGIGGISVILNKPFVIPAGHNFRLFVINKADINVTLEASAWGWEE